VVPTFSAALFAQLNAAPLTIKQVVDTSGPLLPAGHAIGTPSPLAPRLEAAQVSALIKTPATAPVEKPKGAAPAAKPAASKEPAGPPPVIVYDDFAKLDLRVGKVLACAKVEKADKLLQFQVDLGEPQPRLIVSGIAAFYKPEELVGRSVVVVANLAPREFKKQGLTSHGMILSASSGAGAEERLRIVEPPAEAAPGSKVS
jgi:methionyl-tRNA synthetase